MSTSVKIREIFSCISSKAMAASALLASYTSKLASSIRETAPILIRGSSSTIRTAALGLPRSPIRAKLRPDAKVQVIRSYALEDCARPTEGQSSAAPGTQRLGR